MIYIVAGGVPAYGGSYAYSTLGLRHCLDTAVLNTIALQFVIPDRDAKLRFVNEETVGATC